VVRPDDILALRTRLQHEARRLTADADEAEDLVQECMVVLLTRGSTIRHVEHTEAWCRSVLRNLFRARLRRRWYREVLGLSAADEPRHDQWDSIDTHLVLDAALADLPDRVSRTAHDFYLCGQSIGMIARGQRRPEGTIKRWLHEGREALRMALAETRPDARLARIYASDWLDDAHRNVIAALREAEYEPVLCELGEAEALPHDAALFVFGHQAGCRAGLELLLAVRGSEGMADTPIVLFGPGRETAVLAAWKAGADVYLTDPSSPEVVHFLRKLRDACG
jgi:RNA polymerase sigma-70 factor (ECF subfamily)